MYVNVNIYASESTCKQTSCPTTPSSILTTILRRKAAPFIRIAASNKLHFAAGKRKSPETQTGIATLRNNSTRMSHDHHGNGHHDHDHSEGAAHDHTDDLTPALQNHIYEQIDFSAINTLNESEPRSGSKIVQKTWTERLELEPELKSDADEQLLMHVP
jgi:hypothetical protein